MSSISKSFQLSFLSFLLFFIACSEPQPEIKNEIPKKEDQVLFELKSVQESGLGFKNTITDQPLMNVLMYEYYHNGAGVGVGDFNNDGLTDVYFVGNFGKNHIFKNLGNLKFQDVTENSNAEGSFGWSTGVCIVDINNDGLLDIYLSKSGNMDLKDRKNELLVNLGDFKFENRAAEYGLDFSGYSSQAAFFDYDLDGDLDVFIINHPINPRQDLDYEQLKKIDNESGSDKLFRRDGNKYVDVSEKAGIINNSIGFGLGLAISDFNNDRYPDIYVGNDYLEHDYLYINQKDGTFKDLSASKLNHTSNFSMGNDVADFNNDGLIDIYVADMASEDNYRSKTNMSGMAPEKFWKAVNDGFQYQYMINTLQMNNGDLRFSEVSQLSGIDKTDWSWAPLFLDLDNDGWKDLIVTNGLRKEMRNNDFVKKKNELLLDMEGKSSKEQMLVLKKILDLMPQQKISNYAFKNNGDMTFTKKTTDWKFDKPSFSNGAAYADFDNDGDMDIVINNIDDAADLYENKNSQNNYVDVKLIGPKNNINGIGTRLILSSGEFKQTLEQYNSRGYLSSVDFKLHFGLAQTENVKLEIFWPDGKYQSLSNIKLNSVHTVSYSDAKSSQDYKDVENKYQFEDVSEELNLALKTENTEYDDFEDQILLPHKLSELGPALAIADANGDGLEDVFIGGNAGFSSKLYFQTADNKFKNVNIPDFHKNKSGEDIDAVFFDADNDSDLDLYVVRGGYQWDPKSDQYMDLLYLNNGNGNFTLAKDNLIMSAFSGGCVKPFDYDNDGDMDLFVGGRVIPGYYPMPETSYILTNNNGVFKVLESDKTSGLQNLGMVTDAEIFDYNNDGQDDILIVGEWMPVTVLVQENGVFTRKVEIPNSTGWWNCIQKADLDDDGDQDFVLGNLGLNVKYHGTPDQKFHVYAKDFDENGHYDIVLSTSKGKDRLPVRGRQCSSQQLPGIIDKFPTYDLFAKATIEEIYSKEELETAIHYEADNFNSSILINNGKENFELVALAIEAQISSVEGIVVDDFNKDGIKDILLAGNLHEMEVETPRCDASYGIILEGVKGKSIKYEFAKSHLQLSWNIRQLKSLKMANQTYILALRNKGQVTIGKLK